MDGSTIAQGIPAVDGQSGNGTLFTIDPEEFAGSFDKSPFLIGHQLCAHPLLDIDRILKLVCDLPAASVEYNAGTLPIGCDPSQTPRNGLSAEETIRRIGECKSWMAVKNVEADPDYRGLLDRCMVEIGRHSEPVRPGMHKLEAFIFVSSPGSITPYHMDPEHNFLLQIRGSKQMTVFDRDVVTPEQQERFYSGAHRNMAYDETFQSRSRTITLEPGQGLHVPSTMPHFVRNGDDVSISLSITFRTPDLHRIGEAHSFNARLRRVGIRPAPVGQSPARDALKSLTFKALQRSQRLLNRGQDGKQG